jgi:hypothetical protein
VFFLSSLVHFANVAPCISIAHEQWQSQPDFYYKIMVVSSLIVFFGCAFLVFLSLREVPTETVFALIPRSQYSRVTDHYHVFALKTTAERDFWVLALANASVCDDNGLVLGFSIDFFKRVINEFLPRKCSIALLVFKLRTLIDFAMTSNATHFLFRLLQ